MSKFLGTPGEWLVVGDDEVVDGVPCIDVSAGEMGTPAHRRVADVCCTLDDEDDFIITDEDRANAHAIAAVPQLIAALEGLVCALCHQHNEHMPYWQDARAALAAACSGKGEQG